ncbi:MAG TPA: c-type cytochrome [Acidimicrobiia bacterium]
MSLSSAAEAMGLPEGLVQRSAEARAAETGQSVDDILAAWAGGEAPPAAAPVEPSEPEPTEAPEAAEPEQRETPPEPAVPVIEEPEPAAATARGTTPTRAPVPAEVTAAEAAHLPEVVTVPTAGIKERTNFVIPKWLIGLFLVVPFFALFALGGSATGACGEATELTVDVITGEIVNCDGSDFTGGGAGGGGGDPVALGGDIYNGAAVAGVNCAGCHGGSGQGSGAFPALTGVLTTFGSCTDHIEWVTGGSDSVGQGNPYGDTNKISQGGMPAFGGTLTDEQIAAVSAFERVRFGGGDPDETLVDCGLAESGEGEGDAGDGEGGEDGGTSTTVPTEGESDAEASSAHSG